MKNDVVVHRKKEERNSLNNIKHRKFNWTGHILHKNCLLEHVSEGKMEGMER